LGIQIGEFRGWVRGKLAGAGRREWWWERGRGEGRV